MFGVVYTAFKLQTMQNCSSAILNMQRVSYKIQSIWQICFQSLTNLTFSRQDSSNTLFITRCRHNGT